MAKKKQKKLTEKVSDRKQKQETKTNLFELKFNKQKHKVIGRKTTKATAGGIPGASRKRANEHRRKTLLSEFERFGKVNRVLDKRAGDPSLSVEEKAAKRFALERQRRYKNKKGAYSLNEEEETLTHLGQSLADIERHERPLADEEETDMMGADFVSRVHFGGGLRQQEEAFDDAKKGEISRKTLIEELIARSKLDKHEKHMQKEEQKDTTEQLDMQWKEMMHSDVLSNLGQSKESDETPANDDYDKLVRKLQFDRSRGKATDRLKTPGEAAKEERERLERLEIERLKRMKGTSISADDLDDNVALDNDFEVRYKDGILIDAEKVASKKASKIADPEESDSSLSDDDSVTDVTVSATSSEFSADVTTPDQIPFVLSMPGNFESLKQLLRSKSAESQAIVLERLLKCHHPSLEAGNKERLQKLFLLLLQYFDSVSRQPSQDSVLLDYVTSVLYQLTQFSPNHAATSCRNLLKQHTKIYLKRKRRWPGANMLAFLRLLPHLFPASDSWHPVVTPALMLLNTMLSKVHNRDPSDCALGLVVCSIVYAFVQQSKRYVPEMMAYLLGVLHVAIDHEQHERSPTGTFPLQAPYSKMLLIDKKLKQTEVPSFTAAVLNPEGKSTESGKLSCISGCVGLVARVCELYETLPTYATMAQQFVRSLERLPTNFYPQKLADTVASVCSQLQQKIKARSQLTSLIRPLRNQQAKGVQMLEPRIETDFDPERTRRGGAKRGKKADRQRLVHKYKREQRSTVRELRKDNQFLAREKWKKTAEKDMARKRKTDDLMRSLRGQEADFKRMKKMKDKL